MAEVRIDVFDRRARRRTTLVVKHEDGEVTGIGDNPNRKIAENLASLSALYQLDTIGAVCPLYQQLASNDNL